MPVSCWSCRHSHDTGVALAPFCDLYDELVFAKCDAFEYEPGTDADERVQVRPASVAVRPIQPMLYGSNVAGHDGPGGVVSAGEFAAERERGSEA